MQSNEMIHTLQVINSGYLGHGLEGYEKMDCIFMGG
jgi:hypothetical protein